MKGLSNCRFQYSYYSAFGFKATNYARKHLALLNTIKLYQKENKRLMKRICIALIIIGNTTMNNSYINYGLN